MRFYELSKTISKDMIISHLPSLRLINSIYGDVVISENGGDKAHCTGKTGKTKKKTSLSEKTQGIWKFCKNTGNLEILQKHREFGLRKL